MKNITISDISYLIQSDSGCNLDQLSLAILEVSNMLEFERVRAAQIKTKIEELTTPMAIAKFEEYLEKVEENIEVLNVFIKVLFSKKTAIESFKIDYSEIKENIDFNPKNISYLI